MRKFFLNLALLLSALIVGSVNVWGADVTIATATFNGKNATYTEGWSTTGTGKSRTDCIIIGSGENITSPAFDLSGYSKITISIKARRYGSLSGSKATIDASIGSSSKGTTDASGTSATTALTDIVFSPASTMTSAVLVFTCTNATSAGSTHGAGINTITITGTPITTDPEVEAENVSIAYNATDGTIESTINNEVIGGVLSAEKKTTADWLTLGSVSGTDVPFTTTVNDGAVDRTATVTLTYTYNTSETVTKDVVITQGHLAVDYVTLPFNWAGGTKAQMNEVEGVETNADNKDYAEDNAPYRLKFNDTGKYVIIKIDSRPATASMGVKMIGGANTSTMTVQESADGETYTDVQAFSISGSSGDIVNFETTTSFKEDTRYVKFLYTKGSNVGVGPITISAMKTITPSAETDKHYATFYAPYNTKLAAGMKAYIGTFADNTLTLHVFNDSESGTVIPVNTPVVIKSTSADALNAVSTTDEASGVQDGTLLNANNLHGTLVETTAPANAYVLGYNSVESKETGFYQFSGTIPANRAYLIIEGGVAQATGIRIVESENNATSIENIEANEKAVKFFENGRILILRDGNTYDALGRIVK